PRVPDDDSRPYVGVDVPRHVDTCQYSIRIEPPCRPTCFGDLARSPTGGLIVGAATVAALGIARFLPMTINTNDTVVAGHTTSVLVPIVVSASSVPQSSM